MNLIGLHKGNWIITSSPNGNDIEFWRHVTANYDGVKEYKIGGQGVKSGRYEWFIPSQ